ncbi:MAG: toxin HicA [Candidatus Harrisonbacteria bacterium CG10_big_fil_rev_8_21_14_0_10_45_28]|uniref:Toxin HicA n=1 Tax=Candidatus Harrisonbacteria bacterium CG10_big_fil_rev_8_21_14_0_10_45_28 TaxID=1974586 RepID=A0A2H0UPE9_9BACT|nr:MAG: toxin HicA [Candidatus Harrisonbacteria bacterium CG10_big_fil_rev_8_21_14_0_10_45_28]
MTRGISNWTFKNVQTFLLKNGFSLHHIRGSHYYFKKYTSGKIYMTHVQHHGKKSIPKGTLMAIIRQSGIPKEKWIE